MKRFRVVLKGFGGNLNTLFDCTATDATEAIDAARNATGYYAVVSCKQIGGAGLPA